jgi:hypothetical protein
LLNDPVYVEAAEALAARVRTERPGESLDGQLDYAFRLCTARRPTRGERETLRELYESQRSQSDQAAADEDAWFSVATTLLNLHETITKD